jgi:hypothetical protein
MIYYTFNSTQNIDQFLSIISASINSLYLMTDVSYSLQVLHYHQICSFKTVQTAYEKSIINLLTTWFITQ